MGKAETQRPVLTSTDRRALPTQVGWIVVDAETDSGIEREAWLAAVERLDDLTLVPPPPVRTGVNPFTGKPVVIRTKEAETPRASVTRSGVEGGRLLFDRGRIEVAAVGGFDALEQVAEAVAGTLSAEYRSFTGRASPEEPLPLDSPRWSGLRSA